MFREPTPERRTRMMNTPNDRQLPAQVFNSLLDDWPAQIKEQWHAAWMQIQVWGSAWRQSGNVANAGTERHLWAEGPLPAELAARLSYGTSGREPCPGTRRMRWPRSRVQGTRFHVQDAAIGGISAALPKVTKPEHQRSNP